MDFGFNQGNGFNFAQFYGSRRQNTNINSGTIIGNYASVSDSLNYRDSVIGGNFSSVSGAISLRSCELVQDLRVSSMSGSIRLMDIKVNDNQLDVNSISGSIAQTQSTSHSVSTTGGSVNLNNSTVKGNVSSEGGSIHLNNSLVEKTIETRRGTISLIDSTALENVTTQASKI